MSNSLHGLGETRYNVANSLTINENEARSSSSSETERSGNATHTTAQANAHSHNLTRRSGSNLATSLSVLDKDISVKSDVRSVRNGDVTTSDAKVDTYIKANGEVQTAKGVTLTAAQIKIEQERHQTTVANVKAVTTRDKDGNYVTTYTAQAATAGTADTDKTVHATSQTNGGPVTTKDESIDRSDTYAGASTTTGKVTTDVDKSGNKTESTSKGSAQSTGASSDSFTIVDDGTISGAKGTIVTFHKVTEGETAATSTSSTKSTSETDATTTKIDAKTSEVSGTTTSKSTTTSDTDRITNYDATYTTTANGKTTLQHVSVSIESDTETTRTTTTIDQFDQINHAGGPVAAAPKGTVVTSTTDATSKSETEQLKAVTDKSSSTTKDGADLTTTHRTDNVSADISTETEFSSQSKTVTNYGNQTVTTNRTVSGDTVAETDYAAKVNTTTKSDTDKANGLTTTDAKTTQKSTQTWDTEAATSYTATTSSSSTSGATSTRTDHVAQVSDVDTKTVSKYIAIVHSITGASSNSVFSAAA